MKHNIVFLDRSTLVADLRAPNFAHNWTDYPTTEPSEVVRRLADADIAICNKVSITTHILEQLPRLKLIAIAATGTNNVDLESCKRKNISVCNIRDYAQFAVSEHCFALALSLRRNLVAYRQDILDAKWQSAAGFCLFAHPVRDLRGSVLGIIGHGAIGRQTALLGKAFGMEILLAERKSASACRGERTEFDQLISKSDIISIHCPLNEETKGLIGHREFKMMKSEAILLNTARGGIVDEDALLHALNTQEIGGAGFDVLSKEPPTDGHPLLDVDLPNFVITPHVGWASAQAMQALADQLIDNIEGFVSGQAQNLVF